MPTQSVSWLPAHPMVAGLSMQRYWYFMQQAADRANNFEVNCVLGRPGEINNARPEGWVTKAFAKYVSYPMRVRLGGKAGIHHILDHGWAHLMKALPGSAAKIVTVHDLIPLRYRDVLTKDQYDRVWWVINHVKKCQAVIADSAHTKNEIEDLLKIPGDRIHVIPLGVAASSSVIQEPGKIGAALKKIRDDGAEFIVGCLGAAVSRKNLMRLVEAVTHLRERDINIVLARAGPAADGKIGESFHNLSVQGGMVDLGLLKDSEIAQFYAGIDVLCMPSLYEGFGLPVIEAMAEGAPVICSNATSLPEVAGDAALTFDPTDVEELENALTRMMDSGLRKEMSIRGKARAASFTWDRTLEECRNVYRLFEV